VAAAALSRDAWIHTQHKLSVAIAAAHRQIELTNSAAGSRAPPLRTQAPAGRSDIPPYSDALRRCPCRENCRGNGGPRQRASLSTKRGPAVHTATIRSHKSPAVDACHWPLAERNDCFHPAEKTLVSRRRGMRRAL
jgi:hypothetical protein